MSIVPEGHDRVGGVPPTLQDASVGDQKARHAEASAMSPDPGPRELATADVAAGALLVVWGIVWATKGYGYGLRGAGGIAGAGFVPFYLGLALLIMGAGIAGGGVVRRVRGLRHDEAEPGASGTARTLPRLLGCAALVIGFVALMAALGFEVAATVFVAVMIHLFGHARRFALLLYSIGSTAVVSFIFRFLLGLDMPSGVTGSLGDTILRLVG